MKRFALLMVATLASAGLGAQNVVATIFSEGSEIDVIQFQPYGKQPTGSTSVCYSDRIKITSDGNSAVFPIEEIRSIERRSIREYDVYLRDGRVLNVERVFGTLCESSTLRKRKNRDSFEIYYINPLSQRLDRKTVSDYDRVEFYW